MHEFFSNAVQHAYLRVDCARHRPSLLVWRGMHRLVDEIRLECQTRLENSQIS